MTITFLALQTDILMGPFRIVIQKEQKMPMIVVCTSFSPRAIFKLMSPETKSLHTNH